MQFFKSALTLSSLLVLASAMRVDVHEEMSVLSKVHTGKGDIREPSFSTSDSTCDKEDEDDCKEFCSLSDMTPTCKASGKKVTCYCKGGKGGEANCEERCLFCMPSKSAFEEASHVFGGSKIHEL
ncbi:hypothetical protein BX600DRAFT_444960 [Xylariales sp. PMI_506]|nr:hypothetical protein BX600DRAFT_444960 [Xylariales sp. PMI_506]